ncbi:unnamed protein product [marine sediment metagenome]|uniref:Uncharacterized protein n=1 Tax=marine sediment metagenome TaxID=412755 RepID=X1AK77_9ZZZZ
MNVSYDIFVQQIQRLDYQINYCTGLSIGAFVLSLICVLILLIRDNRR